MRTLPLKAEVIVLEFRRMGNTYALAFRLGWEDIAIILGGSGRIGSMVFTSVDLRAKFSSYASKASQTRGSGSYSNQ